MLRYWETEFPMLEPVKSPSGHRMYRQEDVDMVFKIKRLLYDEGFTIAGARRHLRERMARSAWNLRRIRHTLPIPGLLPVGHRGRRGRRDRRKLQRSWRTPENAAEL